MFRLCHCIAGWQAVCAFICLEVMLFVYGGLYCRTVFLKDVFWAARLAKLCLSLIFCQARILARNLWVWVGRNCYDAVSRAIWSYSVFSISHRIMCARDATGMFARSIFRCCVMIACRAIRGGVQCALRNRIFMSTTFV